MSNKPKTPSKKPINTPQLNKRESILIYSLLSQAQVGAPHARTFANAFDKFEKYAKLIQADENAKTK